MNRIRKIILYGLGGLTVLAFIPLFAAFEAHVINVTAQIENALYVHPESRNFGTMFPQEYKELGIQVTFSPSFSESEQTRVSKVDYQIKQKPKPRPDYVSQLGKDAARQWCHDNYPPTPYDPLDPVWQAYLANCYPLLCPYLSKTPDNHPAPGDDVGLPPFHNLSAVATGTINKNSVDVSDTWTIDLAAPCFEGQCAQDWADFVHSHNPQANPDEFMAPVGMSGQTFGCDLWVEVVKIY